MGSRLHGNDGRPRVPTVIPINPELHISVIPAQEDPCTTVIAATAGIQGRRGWVPVSTGTTGDRASLPSFPPNQNFAFPSFPRRKTPAQPSFPRRRESRGGGDGFPSPRERQATARPYRHSHQPRTSHIRHSRAGRPLHNRHSRDGGNPGAAGMGSRLHGNDRRPRVPTVIPAKPELRISVIPAQEDLAYPSFPRRRESRGGEDGFPSPRERRAAAHPVSAASPPTRREYIVSTFTRTGRRRAWRRRSRSGAAPPCPRASPARRRRRSGPASAPSCRSGSGSRPS